MTHTAHDNIVSAQRLGKIFRQLTMVSDTGRTADNNIYRARRLATAFRQQAATAPTLKRAKQLLRRSNRMSEHCLNLIKADTDTQGYDVKSLKGFIKTLVKVI